MKNVDPQEVYDELFENLIAPYCRWKSRHLKKSESFTPFSKNGLIIFRY